MKNAINNRVKEISVFRKGSCATMGYLSFALLVSMAMAAIPKLPNKPETRRHQPEEPKNKGKPLGEKDFSQASELPIIQPPLTTRQLMKIMEDGELKGAKSTNDIQPMRQTRNGLEPIIRHWPNAIVPYVVDASFTESERAVIAQGIKHVEDNSCIRFIPREGDHG